MPTNLSLTIPAGSALSDGIEISTILRVVRIGMPDAWDAAALTFQISPDGNTYLDLHHAQQSVTGEWVSYPATILQTVPNSILLLPPDAGLNIGWLKIRSGTKAQPVKQSADRQFTIVCG